MKTKVWIAGGIVLLLVATGSFLFIAAKDSVPETKIDVSKTATKLPEDSVVAYQNGYEKLTNNEYRISLTRPAASQVQLVYDALMILPTRTDEQWTFVVITEPLPKTVATFPPFIDGTQTSFDAIRAQPVGYTVSSTSTQAQRTYTKIADSTVDGQPAVHIRIHNHVLASNTEDWESDEIWVRSGSENWYFSLSWHTQEGKSLLNDMLTSVRLSPK